MKVVHVVTSLAGGAGIASKRIHRAVKSGGCESSMLCLHDPFAGTDPSINMIPPHFSRFWERAALKAGIRLTRSDRAAATRARLGITGISFSEPFSAYDLARHPALKSADIVHLHWVGDILDWPSFFHRIGKPVVWTLHDMNPILGGFHYEIDRERNSAEAQSLDDELRIAKAGMLPASLKLHIAGPSSWITKLSKQSTTLGRFPHTTVHNPIDCSEWRPADRQFSREILELPADETILLTVSENSDDYRKGADIVHDAVNNSAAGAPVTWASVGSTRTRYGKERQLGIITDQRLLAIAYSAADFLVISSREDNLPNVILEALSVGTPVIGLPAGGVSETLTDGLNGVIGATVDALGLDEAIRRARALTFDRGLIRENASELYAPARIARAYMDIYESLLS